MFYLLTWSLLFLSRFFHILSFIYVVVVFLSSFLLCCLLFHLSFCSCSFVFGFCLFTPLMCHLFYPFLYLFHSASSTFSLFPPVLPFNSGFFLSRCSSLLVLSFCSSASYRRRERARERESPSSIIKPCSTDRRADHQVTEKYRISKNFHKTKSCEMCFNSKAKT